MAQKPAVIAAVGKTAVPEKIVFEELADQFKVTAAFVVIEAPLPLHTLKLAVLVDGHA
jgi:hypothetical protein